MTLGKPCGPFYQGSSVDGSQKSLWYQMPESYPERVLAIVCAYILLLHEGKTMKGSATHPQDDCSFRALVLVLGAAGPLFFSGTVSLGPLMWPHRHSEGSLEFLDCRRPPPKFVFSYTEYWATYSQSIRLPVLNFLLPSTTPRMKLSCAAVLTGLRTPLRSGRRPSLRSGATFVRPARGTVTGMFSTVRSSWLP